MDFKYEDGKFHFDDLTKICVPFCMLDFDTQKRIRTASFYNKKIEMLCLNSQFKSTTFPSWKPDRVYRLAITPVIPDSINWDHVHPDYKYMVRSKDNDVFLSSQKPYIEENIWQISFYTNKVVNAKKIFASYKQGNVDWKDSLVCRPGFEQF